MGIKKKENYGILFHHFHANNKFYFSPGSLTKKKFNDFILKYKNYLFVYGRYTQQAKKQSGRYFKIFEIPYFWPKNVLNIKDKKIGFNPKLFTEKILNIYFEKKTNLIPTEFIFKNNFNWKNWIIFLCKSCHWSKWGF